jgi:hypothetical protein
LKNEGFFGLDLLQMINSIRQKFRIFVQQQSDEITTLGQYVMFQHLAELTVGATK